MNIINIVGQIQKLALEMYPHLIATAVTINELDLANELFTVLSDHYDGRAHFETSFILDLNEDHDHEEDEMKYDSESDLLNEEAFSQDSSQEWEFCEIDTGSERNTFTLEYMIAAVECFDQYGFARVKQRYKRVKDSSYISRFRKYINQNGTNLEKLNCLHMELYDKFKVALLQREIVHDFDLRRWAINISSANGFNNFKASEKWISMFKRKHRIVSRKITKFITKQTIDSFDSIKEKAETFITSAKLRLENYSPELVLNTDQSGFNYLIQSNRMLSFKGEKITTAKTMSMNKQTHSYTIQPIITLAGNLVGQLLICLQETDGKFGKVVSKSIEKARNEYKNVYISCSKSGKLQKDIVRNWVSEVLYKICDNKQLLILDSWNGQKQDVLFVHEDSDLECERMYVPENTTSIAQPLDVYGFRQWKIFVRKMMSRVILDDINVDLTSRINIIKMHSLIHNQLGADMFCNMWLYSWFKCGYLSTRPETFDNVNSLFSTSANICEIDSCNEGQFIRCAHCKIFLCFKDFFEKYHIHGNQESEEMEISD